MPRKCRKIGSRRKSPSPGRMRSASVASLARHAGQVAHLHEGQVVGRQQRQVLELARPGVVVEHVEVDADVRLAAWPRPATGPCRGWSKTSPCRGTPAPGERRTPPPTAPPAVSETTARSRPVGVHLARRSRRRRAASECRSLAQVEPAAEVVVMGLALLALRQQQSALVGGGGERHVAGRRAACGCRRREWFSRCVSSFVSQTSMAGSRRRRRRSRRRRRTPGRVVASLMQGFIPSW